MYFSVNPLLMDGWPRRRAQHSRLLYNETNEILIVHGNQRYRERNWILKDCFQAVGTPGQNIGSDGLVSRLHANPNNEAEIHKPVRWILLSGRRNTRAEHR
jgi:hypothetical protein